MNFPPQLQAAIDRHPYPLLFATVSGAHLYGFPSPDSDWDLRGVHILPVEKVIGLEQLEETIEVAEMRQEIELDLVTHDIKKFFLLLLKRNGYVLEQLFSPLIVQGGPEHDELKFIARDCITRHHSHHYLGFAETQWKLFLKEEPPRVKPLLYLFRVLLTGIYFMRTGIIEANLVTLNLEFKLPYIPELVERKLNGGERQRLNAADISFYQSEYERLRTELENASSLSKLPEEPTARPALNDLLKRLRIGSNHHDGRSQRDRRRVSLVLLLRNTGLWLTARIAVRFLKKAISKTRMPY
ncbi:MAG: nucleotidyltransferase domain-containing protein [Candidatus Obscuribacter sp.]|nr:nucleotidyltransferase domain-containing protein [Candidatus Obscuribacter sp.]